MLCDEKVDLCDPNPCHSNVTCIDLETDYRCVCPQGKTGKKCETTIDPCESSPCENQGTCVAIEVNDQSEPPVPCSNDNTDNTCANAANGYLCQCVEGYEGR